MDEKNNKLYVAVCRDKGSGDLVHATFSSTQSVAVRRMMVACASVPEIQAFPDDFEYTVNFNVLSDPSDLWLSADQFGKLMEVNHGA